MSHHKHAPHRDLSDATLQFGLAVGVRVWGTALHTDAGHALSLHRHTSYVYHARGLAYIWYDMMWHAGVVWRGVVWYGVAWRGVAWRGMVWCGVAAWRGMMWRGMMWRGVV